MTKKVQLAIHRYLVAVLLSSGMVIIFGMKMMLNSLMNNMVYHTYVELINGTSSGFCYRFHSERNVSSVFDWPISEQKWVMESFSWGYLFGNFPGAYMAEEVSAKWTWFLSVSVNVACTFAFPLLNHSQFWQHLTIRIIQGFAGGMVYPATCILLAEWAPHVEKNTLGSIAFSGTILGSILGRVIPSLLIKEMSWHHMYYLIAGLSSIWLLLWSLLVFDKPKYSKYITAKEQEFITRSNIDIIDKKEIIHIYWKKIFTSKPFWALLVMHSSCGTVFTIIQKDIPVYLWDVLHLEMRDILLVLNTSYTVQWLFSLTLGRVLDYLVKHGKITQCWAKKISTLIISGPSWICLMTLGYVKCNIVLAISLISITCVCFGGMNTGYLINHVDIGPKIAGRLMAITNSTASIGAIFAPLVIGDIIDDKNRSITTWRVVFWICGGFFIVDMMCYTIWGQAKNQNYYWEENKSETTVQDTKE